MNTKFKNKRLIFLIAVVLCIVAVLIAVFMPRNENERKYSKKAGILSDTISKIVSEYPGEIGVGVLINNKHKVTVNNESIYPMMSVFKLHQALAVCEDLDNKLISLDSVMTINRGELDPSTWSPMLKEHSEDTISLSIQDLLRYTLAQSDNNASNLMFDRLVSVAQTDSFITTIIPRESFQILYSESEMSADHDKAYSNYTSPIGAAMLIDRLFTTSLLSAEKQIFVKKVLSECATGKDRIVAPLIGKEGIMIAHKTGSGYTNDKGELAAHNDVAYIRLPNGVGYALAVFVKDFKGNEAQASKAIARISEVVYSVLSE